MAKHNYKVWLEWDSQAGLWVTYVPALGHLSTYGETREEALSQTREAIVGYLEAARSEGLPVPITVQDVELVDLEVAIA